MTPNSPQVPMYLLVNREMNTRLDATVAVDKWAKWVGMNVDLKTKVALGENLLAGNAVVVIAKGEDKFVVDLGQRFEVVVPPEDHFL
jgi:hypothetical protein